MTKTNLTQINILTYRDSFIINLLNIIFDFKKNQSEFLYKFENDLFSSIFEEFVDNIPEWIQDAPKIYIKNFIKGFFYLECDTVYNLKRSIAYSLQRLFFKLGKFLYIKKNNCNSYNVYLIKNKKIINDTDYIFIPIKTIMTENLNKKDVSVYNFEVEIDNSYTVQNVVVHNCNTNCQFFVEIIDGIKHLNCLFYMRSVHLLHTFNFNLLSYTVLTYILAMKSDMKPHRIIISCGEYYIDIDNLQINLIKKMIHLQKRPLPKIVLDNNIKYKDFNDITIADFKITGYFPYE